MDTFLTSRTIYLLALHYNYIRVIMVDKMAAKANANQNESANWSINHEIQIISVKNPEKYIGIDFAKEMSWLTEIKKW